MSEPYEIIVAPYDVYVAPTGTPFPAIDVAPAAPWVVLGTKGSLNQGEDGVTVTHEQNIEVYRPNGSTGPIKASRTEEGLMIAISLWDVSLEQYQHALNSNQIAQTPAAAGVAGSRAMGLSRGVDVTLRSLLIRGVSPYGDGFNMQYEVPFAFEGGSPEVPFTKGSPATLALQWTALVDPAASSPDERFGRLIAQDAAALP